MIPLIPERPRDAGVKERLPGRALIEGAHVLAGQASAYLRRLGFDDDVILMWADTYLAEFGSGDIDEFLAWIATKESVAP